MLSGFWDFYPEDYAVKHFIVSRWREVCQRYGFIEYDGPTLEPLELYTQKSGDEIVRQLFNFKDKGGRDIAMRPEMTPTLARMVSAREKQYKKPIKWFSTSQCFRYERTQKGRMREFAQLNCDIIGESGIGADIEALALLVDILKSFGLTDKDFQVRFFSRKFWHIFLTSKDIGLMDEQIPAILSIIDKVERMKPGEMEAKLQELGIKMDGIEKIFLLLTNSDIEQVLSDSDAKSQYIQLQDSYLKLINSMGDAGKFIKLDSRIVRGLAYYTSTTFEAFEIMEGESPIYKGRAIAGGGRYDNLIQQIGGVSLPAIGFGMGDVVLGDLLKEKGLLPNKAKALDIAVIIIDEALRPQALRIVSDLRESGYATDYSLAPQKVGKQFQFAEDRGAKYCVVVAPEEWGRGCVKIKILSTRKEEEVAYDKLSEWFAGRARL